jgi:hypothetical protein
VKESFCSWAAGCGLGHGRKEKGDMVTMDVLHLAPFGRSSPKRSSSLDQARDEEEIKEFFG